MYIYICNLYNTNICIYNICVHIYKLNRFIYLSLNNYVKWNIFICNETYIIFKYILNILNTFIIYLFKPKQLNLFNSVHLYLIDIIYINAVYVFN